MILYVFVLLALSSIVAGQDKQCSAGAFRKYDQSFAKLLTLGSSGRRFPENKDDQLKKYCSQSATYIQDIDNYKGKCMKQLPKQVTGVIVYSVKNQINQLCKKDSKRIIDLITSTPCANFAKTEIDICYSNLIDSYQGAIHAEEKMRVPHVCCEYFKFFQCFKERALKNKNCNEKQVEVMTEFVRSLFGNVVDLICGDYVEGSDKCDNLESPPKKKKNQKKAKSVIQPMIEVLSSIKEV